MTRTLVAPPRARSLLLASALATATLPSCTAVPSAESPVAQAPTEGRASYYSDALAGRPTASGEPYDPAELTAAHRTLPFGTILLVRRADGRSVRVRVNDRGPFGKKTRIVDLSRRAAEELGMVREGVIPVTIAVVGRAER